MLVAFIFLVRLTCIADEPGANAPTPARSLSAPGLPNFFAVGTNLFSGGQPEGDAAFAELARLGVKTIVSVDGAKP